MATKGKNSDTLTGVLSKISPPEPSLPPPTIKKTALEALTERLLLKGLKVKATHIERTVIAVVHETENTNRHFQVTVEGKVTEQEAEIIEKQADRELLGAQPNPNVQ